jgi:hypothetical protein
MLVGSGSFIRLVRLLISKCFCLFARDSYKHTLRSIKVFIFVIRDTKLMGRQCAAKHCEML